MLEKPAISAGLMEHLVWFADFTKLFSFIHPALKKSRLVKGQFDRPYPIPISPVPRLWLSGLMV